MIYKVNLEQAVSEINENASKNFKEALDVAVNLGIDPKKLIKQLEVPQTCHMEMAKLIKLQFLQKERSERCFGEWG